MKNLFLLGGAAVAGYLIYKMTQGNSVAVAPYAYPNGAYNSATLGGQPSEQYPYTAIAPPRVDNQNQPWAANTTAQKAIQSITSPGGSTGSLGEAAAYGSSVSSISDSLSSIWDNLGSTFGWDD